MEEGELAFAPVHRSVTKKCDMINKFILNANSLPALPSRNRGRRLLRPNHPSPHEAPSGPICMEDQEDEEEESAG